MPKKKNILFVCPYPFDEAPSQRFRYEQYLNHLKSLGFNYRIASFLSIKGWDILYKKGNFLKKVIAFISGFLGRKWLLLVLKPYDFIFIHREATPIGPPFFEWIVRYIWRKPIIYDFDDAIWLEDPQEKGTLKSFLKWKSKVASICKWSEKVSCGNQYLADYASQFNEEVVINPTTIDTKGLHLPEKKDGKMQLVTIGWTGTHSTLPYLHPIIDLIRQVHQQLPFKLLIIANKVPEFNFPDLEFKHWNKNTEVADLNSMDIGLMPLTDDLWSKGKCGFKALQYMALEKPVVGSSVGVNAEIIPHGGFLATTDEAWVQHLIQLLKNTKLRTELGTKGRQYINKHYSVESNKDNFLTLFS